MNIAFLTETIATPTPEITRDNVVNAVKATDTYQNLLALIDELKHPGRLLVTIWNALWNNFMALDSDQKKLVIAVIAVTLFITIRYFLHWGIVFECAFPTFTDDTMDHHWWEAFIPIYNVYVMCRVVFNHGWMCIFFFMPIINIVFILLVLPARLAHLYASHSRFLLFLVFYTLPPIGMWYAAKRSVDNPDLWILR